MVIAPTSMLSKQAPPMAEILPATLGFPRFCQFTTPTPMAEILQASHSHLKEGVETLEIAVTFGKSRSNSRNHGKIKKRQK
jgi:hypothetical protein